MEQHLGRKLKRTEVVHHKNEDPRDNDIENLEVMSLAAHGRLHGKEQMHGPLSEVAKQKLRRRFQGEGAPSAKLTEKDVLLIRELLANGAHRATLAIVYEVDTATIYKIEQRKRWKHI